jgi:hypothetical protein
MNGAGTVALVIAVCGALSYAAASILQAVAARRSSGTVKTMGHPLYLAGIVCDMLAWAGSMVALRELAVYVVESILASSLAITVIGARLVLGSRLRRRDSIAIAVTIGALGLLALSAGPQDDVATSGWLRLCLCAAAFAMVLAGWGAAKVDAPGGVVAALAGLSLGGAALIGRVLPVPPGLNGWATAWAIATEPLTLALLTFAGTGMTLYAHALQRGEVGPVTAVHWTAEVTAPSAIALAFLGDTVRPGWGWAALVAGMAIVGAAVLLATAPATNATHDTAVAEVPRPAVPTAARSAVRIIWWGPPPIWRPPDRGAAATVPDRPFAQLTWTPVADGGKFDALGGFEPATSGQGAESRRI